MSIYRGPGGSGDAVNDASSEATLVAQLATEAQADADAAAASATAAANSATAASNSATAAANSATTAASYVPSQTGNSGKYLKTDGTTPSWDDLNISTADISGTLPATNGGTGQSSYAVGDLLFASTTTALSKLADVATGNAVISGGVGVAPSYGKIGLTTHVSGTLPTANGGTNLTSFTANGLLYATSTSALTTGSALTFNGASLAISASDAGAVGGVFVNTNTGTTASAGISGQANSSGLFVLRQYGTGVTGTAFGQTPANYAALVTDGASSNGILIGALTAKPLIFGTNNAERMRLFSSGGLSLGNLTDPGATNLSVTGTIASASTITGTRLISTIATGTAPFTVTSTTQVANLNAATAGTATNQSGGTVSATTLSASGVATFSAGTVSAPAITTTGDTNTGIFFPAADTIAFGEGGVESMRISSDGTVQVGTTNNGYGTFAVYSATNSLLAVANSTSYSRLQQNSADLYINTNVGGAAGGDTIFRRGAAFTESMRIDSAGFVGIGTSSPTQLLEASKNQNDATWLRISNTTSGAFASSGLLLASDTSILATLELDSSAFTGSSNMLRLRHIGAYPIGFWTNNTERMRISSTGDVMIGVTASSGKFHVSGGLTFLERNAAGTQSVLTLNNSNTTAGTQAVKLSFASSGVAKASITSAVYGNGYMAFATNDDTERMRIDASGNVGIGTASPNASAILDAQSTTKGVRMPNMTTTQKNAIASPAAGLMVFDTTLAKLCVYSGSAWQTITSV